MWDLRHLIRVMKRHDMTKKKTKTMTKKCFFLAFLKTEDWGLRIEDWGLRTWLVSIFGLVFNRLDFINIQLGKISPLSTSEKFSFFFPVWHQRHLTAYLTLKRDRCNGIPAKTNKHFLRSRKFLQESNHLEFLQKETNISFEVKHFFRSQTIVQESEFFRNVNVDNGGLLRGMLIMYIWGIPHICYRHHRRCLCK